MATANHHYIKASGTGGSGGHSPVGPTGATREQVRAFSPVEKSAFIANHGQEAYLKAAGIATA